MKLLLIPVLAMLAFAQDGPVSTVDVVNIATLKQMGASVPPTTTDHIRVIITNLDPATVKVIVRLTYFENGEEVKLERTVSRNEVGATLTQWVKDATAITGATATVESQLIPLD